MKNGFGAFVALVWLAALPAHAASVLPLYLDELIDTSTTVFEGRVTENRAERDAATNLVVTYTTFEVREVLKGSVGATHVIKQIGGSLPGENLHYRVHGVPTFAVGEDYVVFLAGVSSLGFSSPIGLGQGKFGIRGAQVSNGRDFKELAERILARLPPVARARLQEAPGPVHEMPLDEFKQTVRNQIRGGR